MKDFELLVNGKYITEDELYDQAIEKIEDILDDYDSDDLMTLVNEYRDYHGYALLWENNSDGLDEALADYSPSEIIKMEWDDCYDYFLLSEGWSTELEFTDSVFEGIDEKDVAIWILDDNLKRAYMTNELDEVLANYVEARIKLEGLSKYQRMMDEVLAKYKNCEADQYDLVYVMEQILRNCDITEREGK